MLTREHLTRCVHVQPPASDADLQSAQAALGKTSPAEYLAFLKLSDGLGVTDRVIWYRCHELPERNATFEVGQYAPTWVMIGGDSGGQGVFLDLGRQEDGQAPVDLQGHGAIGLTEYDTLAPSLTAWLVNRSSSR